LKKTARNVEKEESKGIAMQKTERMTLERLIQTNRKEGERGKRGGLLSRNGKGSNSLMSERQRKREYILGNQNNDRSGRRGSCRGGFQKSDLDERRGGN